jgi:2-polyprenyl-3-methyl-5-hydroxy-6-metoxy-1,4-benzoquinol methylase
MTNLKFYNKFFQIKGSFLDREDKSIYSERAYLSSIGFLTAETDWKGLDVCEIGGGLGRLTAPLENMGMIKNVTRYVLVEPSESINALKERFTGKNFEFHNSNLAEFSAAHIGKFDYVIACGVIPHIDDNLSNIMKELGALLKKGGTLHIAHSYYGYPKLGARFLWNLSRKSTAVIKFVSFLTALLQVICNYSLFSEFYRKNFIYSFQKTFFGIYNQHFEYFGVCPYNIFNGYGVLLKALSQVGFSDVIFYPHSIAFSVKLKAGDDTKVNIPMGKPFAIIGNDWSCRWVCSQLNYLGDVRCVDDIAEVRSDDIIVIGHDHISGASYHVMVNYFVKSGRVLGKDIFLFQMLLQ